MTGTRCVVVALHGFLGAASDWEPVAAAYPQARWEAVDLWTLFSDPALADWPSIGGAVEAAIRGVRERTALPVFLVGYSLGARLALSMPGVGSASSPLAGVCLVSCNPGLPEADREARAARRASDEAWARRLIEAPVNQIWKEWDAQPVFSGSAVPQREARLPAPRVTLARALRLASLASQPDRRPALAGWEQPLLWVTGERDPKFRAMAAALEAPTARVRFATVEHAGHRVPWDNPPAFARILQEWIDLTLHHAQ